jgi:hypothetical protein
MGRRRACKEGNRERKIIDEEREKRKGGREINERRTKGRMVEREEKGTGRIKERNIQTYGRIILKWIWGNRVGGCGLYSSGSG